jgi:ubiquitin C-terminal hydrolase
VDVEKLTEDEKIRLQEFEEAKKRPPSYYEYKLAGILVHRGTSDSGHYYSFIKVSV